MTGEPADEMRLLAIGDIQCTCGVAFRYALATDGATFWPQNSVWGFCTTPISGDTCIRCSAPLADLIPTSRGRASAAA